MSKFIKGWHEGMSVEDTKDLAYFERNMLALHYAIYVNKLCSNSGWDEECGWYYDIDNNWDGWKRVISLDNGGVTFHIPDDFDLGSLKQIKPNWDGHSTEQKWTRIMKECGCKVDQE